MALKPIESPLRRGAGALLLGGSWVVLSRVISPRIEARTIAIVLISPTYNYP